MIGGTAEVVPKMADAGRIGEMTRALRHEGASDGEMTAVLVRGTTAGATPKAAVEVLEADNVKVGETLAAHPVPSGRNRREDRRETREERERVSHETKRNAEPLRCARAWRRHRPSGQFPAEREEHIDQWIDEGPVRDEAEQAVQRARPARANNFELDSEVRDRVNASVSSPQRAAKLRERLLGAFVSLERERYAERVVSEIS